MNYETDGYEIYRDVVTHEALMRMEASIQTLFSMQKKKLGIKAGFSFEELLARNPSAFNAAIQMATQSAAGHALAALRYIHAIASDILGPENFVISGPSLFVNQPNETSRLYTWHCEKHWYPKRRNFVNFWMPFIHHKHSRNGTMAVIPGSHKREWAFQEYRGYENNPDGLVQYEVPESEINDPAIHIEAAPGDLVAFHPGLLHRSTLNTSNQTTYALTLRMFDYSKDLTLSADHAERPYQMKDAPPMFGRAVC